MQKLDELVASAKRSSLVLSPEECLLVDANSLNKDIKELSSLSDTLVDKVRLKQKYLLSLKRLKIDPNNKILQALPERLERLELEISDLRNKISNISENNYKRFI